MMDTISQFCTRIRNASTAQHKKVDIPSSKIQAGIAEQLKQYGYIKNYSIVEDGKQGLMRIYLRYSEKGIAAITNIERLSKPSCRQYVKAGSIPLVLANYGLLVLSTNEGILSGREATKKNVGGELLCRIW